MKLVICDTMDHWISRKPREAKKGSAAHQMLVINDSEARLFSGRNNIVQAARAILRMGPKSGSHQARRIRRVAVFRFVDFRDPGLSTRRGFRSYRGRRFFRRRFNGSTRAFGGYWPGRPETGIVYGSVVASFTVEDFGVKRLTNLSLNDIEERYKSLAS